MKAGQLVNDPDEAVLAAPCQHLRENFSGRRVLLVEDEPINQEIAIAMLDEAGLLVDPVGDGQAALERFTQEKYDLVLMDMMMPGMDGLTAARRLRELPGGAAIPIIAMTANAFVEDKVRCMEAGMDDFVTKPVDPECLYAAVLKGLRKASDGESEPLGD